MKKLYTFYFILLALIIVSILHSVLGSDFRKGFKEGWNDGLESDNDELNGIYWRGTYLYDLETNIVIVDTLKEPAAIVKSKKLVTKIYLKDYELYKQIKVYNIICNLLVLPLLIIIIWMLFLFVNLFRTIKTALKNGDAFSLEISCNLNKLGIVIILFFIVANLISFLQNKCAFIMFQNSSMNITINYDIEYIYLIFGVALMFVAEYIKIGYKLQEEQNLTI